MNTNVICPTSASEDNHYPLERAYSRLRAPNEETVLLHLKIPLRLGRWLSRQSDHHTSLGPEFGFPYLYKSQAWWYICNPRTSRSSLDLSLTPGLHTYVCMHAHMHRHTHRGGRRGRKEGRREPSLLCLVCINFWTEIIGLVE